MYNKFLPKSRALLLVFFIVNYSFAGTIPDQNQTSQVIKKYGIDENGRSFEYTVPTATSPAITAGPSRLIPPNTTRHYGIDQNGRSFEYDENLIPSHPSTVAAKPAPARQVVVITAPKPVKQAAVVLPLPPKPLPTPTHTVTAVTKAPAHKPAPGASRSTQVAQGHPKTGVKSVASAAKSSRLPAPVAVITNVSRQTTPTVKTHDMTHVQGKTATHAHLNPEFIVKVSAWNNPSSNRFLERDLKKLGARSIKSRLVRENKPVHRLLYARHQDRSRAYLDMKTLQSSNQKAYIISTNGIHSVYCGAFYHEERATSEQNKIADKGIRVTIAKDSVWVTNKFYMAGGFHSRVAADKLAGILQQRGIRTTVVSAEPYLAQKSRVDDIRG